ncbi:MAG: L,D-transpeptidase [Hyphomicrobiales bacterium]
MGVFLTRRALVIGAAFSLVNAAGAHAETSGAAEVKKNFKSQFDTTPGTPTTKPVIAVPAPQEVVPPGEEQYFNPDLLPPAESETDFPVTPVKASIIPKQFRRQTVQYTGPEAAGTVVVDPHAHFLYFVLGGGQAIRYGVGVGRAGFEWSGDAEIRMKRKWPRWVPPREMVDRDQHAKDWVNGMPGGPGNPLGARALYLYSGGKDTMFRIHGTNEPTSIGKSMSSGCIRMLNEDVVDLFDRVEVGTKVVVRS